MKQMNSNFSAGLAQLGWPGMVGLGLAVFVGAFYFSTLLPLQAQLEELQKQNVKERLHGAAKTRESEYSNAPRDTLSAFYGYFPQPTALPDLLDKVFAAAKAQGLELKHGEYRAVNDKVSGMTQFQISLPVRGSYPQIRGFVDRTLSDVPTLSLQGIQFDRQKVGETAVDAKVSLDVYLGKKS
jgi:Tfp pilus assembly protein PilO